MNRFKKDFDDFITSDASELPKRLDQSTRALILNELNPSWSRISIKILFIHTLISIITLSVCQQFGVRLFFDGAGLMNAFMNFGYVGCMAACGAFYIGSTYLLLPILLNIDEARKLKSQLWWQPGALAAISLAFLSSVGEALPLIAAAAWLISAWLTGLLGFIFGRFLHLNFPLRS